RETEPEQHRTGARASGVAADLAKPLVRARDAGRVALALRACERLLERAELRVAVEDVLDRGLRRRRRLLLDRGDRKIARQRDLAFVRRELAEQHREQARLAAAVAADDADAPAGIDGERKVSEQHPRAAPQRDVG